MPITREPRLENRQGFLAWKGYLLYGAVHRLSHIAPAIVTAQLDDFFEERPRQSGHTTSY